MSSCNLDWGSFGTEWRPAHLLYHCLGLSKFDSQLQTLYLQCSPNRCNRWHLHSHTNAFPPCRCVGCTSHSINRSKIFQMVPIESEVQHLVLNAAQVRCPPPPMMGHDGTQPNGRVYDVRLVEWPTPYISWALSGLIRGLCTWYSHRLGELQTHFHWHGWLTEGNWQIGRKRNIKIHNKTGRNSLCPHCVRVFNWSQ